MIVDALVVMLANIVTVTPDGTLID